MTPFLFILLGTLSGILACELGLRLDLSAAFLGAALFFASGFYFFKRQRGFFCGLIIYCGAALGGIIHYCASDKKPILKEGSEFIQGKILECRPWESNQTFSCTLKLQTKREKLKFLLFSRAPFPLKEGDFLALFAKINKIKGKAAPGCFDQAAYYARENIYRTGTAESKVLLWWPQKENFLSKLRSESFRALTSEKYQEASKLLRLMLLGSREKLSKSIEDGLRKSGAAHILAISGLHIALLGGVWFFLLKIIRLDRLYLELPLLPALWFYAWFLGERPSVSRAVLLMTFLILARQLRQGATPVHYLGMSAFLYALLRPKQIFSYSSLLSYAATAALLCFLPALFVKESEEGLLRKLDASWFFRLRYSLFYYLLQSLKISCIVSFFTFPILIYMLHYLAPLGFLMNLIIIPLCALILCGGLFRLFTFSLHLAFLDTLWELTLWPWEKLFPLLTKVGTNHFLIFNVAEPSPSWLLIYFLTLCAFILSETQEKTKIFRHIFLFCGFLLLFNFFHLSPPDTASRLTALNVGQGDAFVVKAPGTLTLVDAGRSMGNSSMGETVVVPYLRSLGAQSLDAFVISHYDDDHSGGAKDVLKTFQVKEVIAPPLMDYETRGQALRELAEANGIKWRETSAGDFFYLGKIPAYCLWPPKDNLPADSNSRSLVLLLNQKGRLLLFTGDAPSECETNQFLALEKLFQGKFPGLTLYKIPHHGSKYSGASFFLRYLKPRLSLLSVGKNPYYLPHPTLLKKYENMKLPILNTQKDGTYTVILRNLPAQLPLGVDDVPIQK